MTNEDQSERNIPRHKDFMDTRRVLQTMPETAEVVEQGKSQGEKKRSLAGIWNAKDGPGPAAWRKHEGK